MIEPPLVAQARASAAAIGFTKGSRAEDGRLLHVLAGRRGIERAAEIGTGTGIGTAWLAAALPPGVPLFTCDPDPVCAAAAAALFADDPDVHVLAGDWREVLPPLAPFDFVFVDGGTAKDDLDGVLGIAVPGATLVLDDFSADWPGPDRRRELWLRDPRLAAVELGTGEVARAIVAVVRR
ncbi:MAG: O-methyltransferase [Gaiella sp.]